MFPADFRRERNSGGHRPNSPAATGPEALAYLARAMHADRQASGRDLRRDFRHWSDDGPARSYTNNPAYYGFSIPKRSGSAKRG